MKHLLSTALLCGMSVLAMQAQNIIVVDKDGLPHRFHADYVQDISFVKITESPGTEIKFDQIDVTSWGNTNELLTFTQGSTSVALEIYQPEGFYLQPGNYTVDPSGNSYTIDNSSRYTEITLNGTKRTLESGQMTITLDEEIYTITFNLTLDQGETLKGSYNGELNKFGPVITFTLNECKYVEVNDPAPNGFYYGFHDTSYGVEMRIELFTDGTTVGNGTYTFATTEANGTASSYVNLYNPYNEATSFREGTVTISGEGANRVIEINGVLENGMKMRASYTGEIPPRPGTVTPDPGTEGNVAFTEALIEAYGTRNLQLTLKKGTEFIRFDMYQPAADYLQAGTYTVDNGSMDNFTIDSGYSTLSTLNGVMQGVKSGTVVVAKDGDTYTFTVDVVLKNDNPLKGSYTGVPTIESF